MTQSAAPSSGVTLPAAVRKQVEAANAAIEQANGAPPAPPAPAAAAPSPAPAPHAAPPPAPGAAVTPPQITVEERLRQSEARYASLQGKYNAETAALREQVNQNSQLVSQLLERATAPAPAPAEPPRPQDPKEYLRSLGVRDKAIEDYGDLLPLVVDIAQKMTKPTVEKLEGQIRQLTNDNKRLSVSTAQARQNAILAALDMAVPEWRRINEDAHFLDWLKIVDIFSGVTRHVALANAFQNLDQARVVGIFEAYAREYPEQARAPGAAVVDPATLVAPEVRGGTPPATPEGSGSKKIWSEAEIRAFYARVRKKQVPAEEYQRFQAEIASAVAEGRVRPEKPQHVTNA